MTTPKSVNGSRLEKNDVMNPSRTRKAKEALIEEHMSAAMEIAQRDHPDLKWSVRVTSKGWIEYRAELPE